MECKRECAPRFSSRPVAKSEQQVTFSEYIPTDVSHFFELRKLELTAENVKMSPAKIGLAVVLSLLTAATAVAQRAGSALGTSEGSQAAACNLATTQASRDAQAALDPRTGQFSQTIHIGDCTCDKSTTANLTIYSCQVTWAVDIRRGS